VEIPGGGALANLLFVQAGTGSVPTTVQAAPVAMADNTFCPDFKDSTNFLYVNVPAPSATSTPNTSDYGTVGIQTQGSDVTFTASPYLIGPVSGNISVGTGGCSVSTLGALTAFPLNSYGSPSDTELISIGKSGLLVSSFRTLSGQPSLGAFGGGNGVIGVQESSTQIDVSNAVNVKYSGFMYAPKNAGAGTTYDITVLASAFGNHTGDSAACSGLQSSILANLGGNINAVPYTDTIYGGEFRSVNAAGNTVNDPTTGQLGSENCDVAVTLGTEDPNNNGLFPNATIYIGSGFPPFSASNP
jgi:hypothetical protein